MRLLMRNVMLGIDKGSRVYFDVNPIIYFIEELEQTNAFLKQAVLPLFEMIGNGDILAFTSELSLTEILIKPIREKLEDVVKAHKELLLDTQLFTLVKADSTLFLKAAYIGGTSNLRTPDAIHVASAITSQCDYFVTNDRKIKSQLGLKVVQVLELGRG